MERVFKIWNEVWDMGDKNVNFGLMLCALSAFVTVAYILFALYLKSIGWTRTGMFMAGIPYGVLLTQYVLVGPPKSRNDDGE